MKNLHIVSLGCAKARVDTELMVGHLRRFGWRLCALPEDADAIVLNTCGFLQSAIEESIDTILELADYKAGRCKRLVMSGCLPSRWRGNLEELVESLPEVDAFVTTDRLQDIVQAVEGAPAEWPDGDLYLDRQLVEPQSYAYLKISEGCDRRCSFCTIPLIRGRQISRPIPSLVNEARQLLTGGCKELVLIAQELTHYGADIGNKGGLMPLLDELESLDNLHWLRLMYAYPWNFPEALFERLGKGKIIPYVDIPLQHVSQRILKSMRRMVTEDAQKALLTRLREIPGLVLRTSLIVGYPGETDEEFQALVDWIQDVEFDRLGVFTYSAEEGTKAATLPAQIPEAVKQERFEHIMEVQQSIHRKKMEAMIGRELQVLVDGPSPEHPLVLEGRYYGQAPEVDGVVYLSYEESDEEPAQIGDFVNVRIVEASDYDLLGHV